MCLTGSLLEMLCSAADEVEAFDEVVNVVEEIRQSPELMEFSDEPKHIQRNAQDTPKSVDLSAAEGDNESAQVDHAAKNLVSAVMSKAIETLNVIKNSLSAVQDYQNGEKMSEILKQRTIFLVESQVPKPILEHIEAELSEL